MKTKNKLLASVLCLLIVVFCAICLTSCLGENTCTHEWGEWSTTKNATCTEAGAKERECTKCGEAEQAIIDALNHDWNEATCSAPKSCKNCSATEGEALAHAYTNENIKEEALKSAATCKNAAVYYKSCFCGAVSESDADTFTSGSAVEHFDSAEDKDHLCDYGCNAVIENCSDSQNDGDHSCDICGNTDITTHNYGDATCGAPATCVECGATTGATLEHTDANHDHICDNNCGKNDMGACADSSEDKDHICDYGNGFDNGCKAIFENCYDADTDNDHACDVCGKADVTVHTYIEDTESTKEATCTDAAAKIYVCNCGHSYKETVGDALGHDITGVTPSQKPGSDACSFILVYQCKRGDCKKNIDGETIYNHTYIASIGKAATCISEGEKTFKCSACGDTSKASEIIKADATGHNWDTSATVTNGVRTDKCLLCSETKNVIVAQSNSASSNASDLANTDVQLKVDESTNANIQLGQGVADAIGDQDITISADVVDKGTLESIGVSKEQLAQIGSNTVFDFNIKDKDGENVSGFGEDNFVTITLPYELSEGEDVDSIAVWFISDVCQVAECDKGEGCVDAHKLVSIKATYNNETVTFKTNHFSYYTVTKLTPTERCALYGHGYAEQVVEGSCTKDAYVLLVCVRCHDKQIKEGTFVKADGHDYKVTTENATCTQNGYTIYACNDCSHIYRIKINATGHKWEIEESQEASCAADGFAKYGCANCDDEYTVSYAKLAHIYTESVVNATCTADGYTLHDCDNCDYSYTDNYIDALGHAYESTTWDWALDYSTAAVTFVCENDSAHKMVVNATVTKTVVTGVCSNFEKTTYTAAASYNGTEYTDEKVVEVGTPNHTFSTEWSKDENGHWHECVCGQRADAGEHSFENDTVTKAPTCSLDGESTAYCVCGEARVTSIPATGEHNYIDGTCDMCGKIEFVCDHADLHKESIDFGDLGACASTIYYYTCECGEVKTIFDGLDLNCKFDILYKEDEYIDENGNEVMTLETACSCGLQIIADAVYIEEECTETLKYNFLFKIEGKEDISIAFEITEKNHYYTKIVDVDATEYGACGGTISLYQCKACGEFDDVDDFDLDCNIDLENEPVPEEIIDANGIVHIVQSVECPDCGLTISVDVWEDELSVCETLSYYRIAITCGENTIMDCLDIEYDDNHEYEKTSEELLGETCLDGVKYVYYCRLCEEVSSDYSYSHKTEPVNIDLSEYSTCGGTIEAYLCEICDTITDINETDINCNLSDDIEEEMTDDEGNVIGTKITCYCLDCGLIFVEQEWTEWASSCQYSNNEGQYIYNGEDCIFECVRYDYRVSHDYIYELMSGSCEGENKVKVKCTRCGYSYTLLNTAHIIEEIEINFADYNCCAGTITANKCQICGEITSLDDVDTECNFEESEPEEITGDDGITHYITTSECSVCSLKFIVDEWTVQEGSCITYNYSQTSIYNDDILIIESVYGETETSHKYETEYEMFGETCFNGYRVIKTCSVCEYKYEYYSSGHSRKYIDIDLQEKGFCGGFISETHCVICNTIISSEISDYYCIWEYIEENPDGYTEYDCSECGATKLMKNHYSEKNENCEYTQTNIIIYIINGEEIYRKETSFKETDHRKEYSIEMNGVSCLDGFIVTETCQDCDYSYEETLYTHNLYTVFEEEESQCFHSIKIEACPCGENFDYNFTNLYSNNDNSNLYSCDDCDTAVLYEEDIVKEGCTEIDTTYIVVYSGDIELYSYEKERLYASHTFSGLETSFVDGVTTIVSICEDCGTQKIKEIQSVELENHNDRYYYDYEFIPNESSVYTIMGASNEDTYVVLYKMVDGEMIEVNRDDDGGYNQQFKLSANLTSGVTYIYRIRFYNDASDGTINFVLEEQGVDGKQCNGPHSDRAFGVLSDGAQSCEDGAILGYICLKCGSISRAIFTNNHDEFIRDRVDLSKQGACDGCEIAYYSCACGYKQYVSGHLCYNDVTTNSYLDEEGRLIDVEVKHCSDCGLRYTESSYAVSDYENCKVINYVTVVINIGDKLISEYEYTNSVESHDYETSYSLVEGDGSSCLQGVNVTYKCKVCDDEYAETYYNHRRYTKETIDLASLGSACGGYAIISECACGKYNSLSIDDSLCEFDTQRCDMWIEDALSTDQYNINGYSSFYSEAYIYVCSVTDPDACAFVIRYASYWLKEEGSCSARRYITWQLGYNSETGECLNEITLDTNTTKMYHNYVDGSTEDCQRYDCADCGSYYYKNRYYDDDGNLLKSESIISNTLDNGYDKYCESITEYSIDENGNRYLSREYEKTIYCDGSEYWNESINKTEAYVGEFGENGRKTISSNTDSQGYVTERESAYVFYKGYRFEIYEYIQDGTFWQRTDWTYSFDNGCVQTAVYTDSDGEREEFTQNICRLWDIVTIKEPTCTQEGEESAACVICGKNDIQYTKPYDHEWVYIDEDWYCCVRCGLENENGASGDIIMEDLTAKYGREENYVVGYLNQNNVEFTKYISLILLDGTEVVVSNEIEITTIDGVRAFVFNKKAVKQWASANGYTNYDVRFSFVPVGSDGSFDYGLTFTEEASIDAVIRESVIVTANIEAGQIQSYTITPNEDSDWVFISISNGDTVGNIVHNAFDEKMKEDDDNGYNRNFMFTERLTGGETYTVNVRWYDSTTKGNVTLICLSRPSQQ